jgi:hypothetical protein
MRQTKSHPSIEQQEKKSDSQPTQLVSTDNDSNSIAPNGGNNPTIEMPHAADEDDTLFIQGNDTLH